MQSRSSALSNFDVQLGPWTISALAHAGLAALILSVLLVGGGGKRFEKLEVAVIDKPRAVPAAVSVSKPKPKPSRHKPRAVFGVTSKAMQDAASPVEAPRGNTVAAEPKGDRLRPGDEESLPVPVDEYLVTRMPQLDADVRVPYPPEARARGAQGAVVMELLIDGDGKVRETRLIAGTDPALDEAALRAAHEFRFKPALAEDKPVAVRIRYSYRFVLER